MAHETTGVTGMKDPTKGLGKIIGRVNNARNMDEANVSLLAPVLDSKKLNVNMPGTFGGFHGVDHSYC